MKNIRLCSSLTALAAAADAAVTAAVSACVVYAKRTDAGIPIDPSIDATARDGLEHPSGPWIKCKGAGIDLQNPSFC